MNAREGMFRLWLVGSALFVVGVAVTSYANIRDEFRNAYTDFDAEMSRLGGNSMFPTSCDKARGTLDSDYSRDNDGLCWYATKDFRRLYPEYNDIQWRELSKLLYAKAGRPLKEFHPWAEVLKTAGLAFGVPLAVLGLGIALRWVFAGFRVAKSSI